MVGGDGRPIIELSQLGLTDRDTAVMTVLHEMYHQKMLSTFGNPGTEADAEQYAVQRFQKLF
jgi:hypothetical protein